MPSAWPRLALPLFVACAIACSTSDEGAPPDSDDDETRTAEPKSPDAGPNEAPEVDAGSPEPDLVGPPRVDVATTGAYGTHDFEVPATAHWVNSGLYLKNGETAEVTVEGTWDTTAKGLGPEGGTTPNRTCKDGGLVARSDLQYEDETIYCLGRTTTVTAARDGILYFGSLIETDLGADTYDLRKEFAGSLRVTVTSAAKTVPWVAAKNATSFAFADSKTNGSGHLEIVGKHVIVVTTAAQAESDKDGLVAALAFLDELYESHAAHRGTTPFDGQRIRMIADPAIEGIGYMLAGNPIRMSPAVFTGTSDGTEHLLRSAEKRRGVWGFAHEMGHTFASTGGNWWYQVGPFLEAWPNVFSTHSLRELGRPNPEWGGNDPAYPSAKICPTRATQLASGTYETLKSDPALSLCFLLEFEETYGETFFPRFFEKLNATGEGKVPYSEDGKMTWGWIRDRFSEIAKTDTTPIFTKWKVPLP